MRKVSTVAQTLLCIREFTWKKSHTSGLCVRAVSSWVWTSLPSRKWGLKQKSYIINTVYVIKAFIVAQPFFSIRQYTLVKTTSVMGVKKVWILALMHRKPLGCLDRKSHNLKKKVFYTSELIKRKTCRWISDFPQISDFIGGQRERESTVLGTVRKALCREWLYQDTIISHICEELHKCSGFWKTFHTRSFIRSEAVHVQYGSSPAVVSPHHYKRIHTREQPFKCFVSAVLWTLCTPYWISEKSPWGETPEIRGKSSNKILTFLPIREAILV